MKRRYQIGADPVLTVGELRSVGKGLVNRANRTANGKQDSLNRGWTALENLYSYANATLPTKFQLDGEAETWENIARLANVIVTACDKIETHPEHH